VDPRFTVDTNIEILIVQNKDRVTRFWVLLLNISARWCKSHKLPYGLIVLLWIIFAPMAHGTEIIIVKTDGWVVLAADSLYVRPGDRPYNGCKIRQSADLFWAASGVDADAITGFKVDTFLADAIKLRLSVAKTLDAAGGAKLITALNREAPILKSKAPDLYSKLIRGGSILSLFAVRVSGRQIDA
jgi:hypothetical protein